MKRDVKIYGLYLVAVIAISMFAGCVGQGIDDPMDSIKISFEDIASGQYSELRERGTYVIRNESDWNSFMDKFGVNLDKPDLSERTVIVVAMGEKNTGGYSIQVKEILEYGDRIKVHVEEVSPTEGDMVTQALTQPYHIVSIERTEKPIEFTYSAAVKKQ